MTFGSEFHVTIPVNGSNDRDFNFVKVVVFVTVDVVIGANDPSDLALTRRSNVGMRF